RTHMIETFRRAHDHRGSGFVEIYQNCNVFNDGAFAKVTARDARGHMLIPLVHGRPVRFGAHDERGVVVDRQGRVRIVDVADVGEDAILVHDEGREEPDLAFMLSRLARGPHEPTPIGVFRAVERPDYGRLVNDQVLAASAAEGPGDLAQLLASGTTWQV
ncbi:MAG: 2-oxoacid:ferredoxin oxidoreductase subunit beta, partial [Actinobacteria bacterium]|nr:2-oxoacid:ferredoxin oxidoreductase subunit beta [Actinomycetota bacterium]